MERKNHINFEKIQLYLLKKPKCQLVHCLKGFDFGIQASGDYILYTKVSLLIMIFFSKVF